MDSVCVTIQWGGVKSGDMEPEYSVQYHGFIIPEMGREFSYWTSRDDNGCYRKSLPGNPLAGDIREVVTGIVSDIKYHYEVWGEDRHLNKQTMYVTVVLSSYKMGDAWEIKGGSQDNGLEM